MKHTRVERLFILCLMGATIAITASSSVKPKDVPADTQKVEIKDIPSAQIVSTKDSIYFMDKDGKKIIKQMAKRTMTSTKEGDKYRVTENRVEAISGNKNIAVMSEIERLMNYDPVTANHEFVYEGEENYKVQVLNAEGKEIFEKQIKVYDRNLPGYPSFKTKISADESTIYMIICIETRKYQITAYNSVGGEISKGEFNNSFEGDVYISPDGSLLCAMSYNEKGGVLFFMKTSTGEIKVRKQGVDYQGRKQRLRGWPQKNEIVNIVSMDGSINPPIYVSFDSLPEDLSSLLLK